MPDTFQLEIVTPSRLLVKDAAEEAQIPGLSGYLGILPGHAPLLTELGVGAITYKASGATHTLALAWGFAEVLPDKVTILAEAAERPDLAQTLVRRGRTCRSGRVCYVVVQVGRLYFLNQDAVANLSRRTPWHVERIRGREVVKVYRLLPGEMPFPDEQDPGTGPLVRSR